MTYDDLLYHPCEDELNSNWAQSKLTKKSGNTTFCQLSCSKCFIAVTYQGKVLKNKRKLGDYVADVESV
jgi:hypothetical protein